MNSHALKLKRVDKGFSMEEMASVIGKSVSSYYNKEKGKSAFSDEEKVLVSEKLVMTPEEFSSIFFDSRLPNGN